MHPVRTSRSANNVKWEYVVSNTGNLPLSNVTVADDQGVWSMSANYFGSKRADDLHCDRHRNSRPVREHRNSSGDNGGTTYTDTDPSHYFGYITSLKLTKYTNGADANSPTGPYIKPGSPVRGRT